MRVAHYFFLSEKNFRKAHVALVDKKSQMSFKRQRATSRGFAMKTQENDVEDSFGEDREVSQARRIRDQVFQTFLYTHIRRVELNQFAATPARQSRVCFNGYFSRHPWKARS
jgi:hypothetical protein